MSNRLCKHCRHEIKYHGKLYGMMCNYIQFSGGECECKRFEE